MEDTQMLSKSHGFTIVEILIVLSIISILIGVTLNRFTGQSSEKIHQANVESVVNLLTIARAKANAGESDICPQSNESLYQIQVSLKDATTLELKHTCYPTFAVVDTSNLPTPIIGQESKISTTSSLTSTGSTIVTYTRRGTTVTGTDLQVSTSSVTPYNTCIRVCDTGSIVQKALLCSAMPANVCN